MNETLARFEFHSPEQAHDVIARGMWPYVKDRTGHGQRLVATVCLLDDDITNAQRNYLHGVVLTEISMFARANGQQFPMAVWKEHFRSEFLGFKLVTAINPFTGRKSRRRVRVSTEDLGIKAMAEYIDRVIAFAATELGVQVSEPLPPHLRPQRRQKKARNVDAETGEILEAA